MPLPSYDSISYIFNNEEQCIEFLEERNVFYKELNCIIDHCPGIMRRIGSRKILRCSKCQYETNFKAFTFFYGSNLKCGTILKIAYYWLLGLKHQQIVETTKVSKQAVTNFLNHFRTLIQVSDFEYLKIGGKDVVVEIDETKIGKRKYHRGHRVEGVWCVGGVEKTAERRVFIVPVTNRNQATISEIIEKYVEKGSIIRTDCWKAYDFLNKSIEYKHEVVNHSKEFKNNENGCHTNTIEGTWSGLKPKIQPRNRVEKNIEGHLFEFIWRRQHSNEDIWKCFIKCLRDVHYDY